MKQKRLKTRKVKNFRVSLNCTVLPESEFTEDYQKIYSFISSTYSPCKSYSCESDFCYNQRSFYILRSYTFIQSFMNDISYEAYLELPRFICVERGCIYFPSAIK